ncbi:MAG: type II secretion system major pseudopilin GspG [Opitutaceae bacterium]
MTHSQSRRSTRAFTLLEILIAIAILGLLVGVAVANLDKIFGNSQESIAKLFVQESIKIPLNTYRMAMGSYPSSTDGLNALVTAPGNSNGNWRGPYIADGKLPLDPWGQPYQYAYPGVHNKDSYDVWSKGPPGSTENDIGNW